VAYNEDSIGIFKCGWKHRWFSIVKKCLVNVYISSAIQLVFLNQVFCFVLQKIKGKKKNPKIDINIKPPDSK